MKQFIKTILLSLVVLALVGCSTMNKDQSGADTSERVVKSAKTKNYDLSKAGVGVLSDIF